MNAICGLTLAQRCCDSTPNDDRRPRAVYTSHLVPAHQELADQASPGAVNCSHLPDGDGALNAGRRNQSMASSATERVKELLARKRAAEEEAATARILGAAQQLKEKAEGEARLFPR